jgi:hypothetical protein
MPLMNTIASILGKKTVDVAPKPTVDRPVQAQMPPDIARREQVLSQSTFYKGGLNSEVQHLID